MEATALLNSVAFFLNAFRLHFFAMGQKQLIHAAIDGNVNVVDAIRIDDPYNHGPYRRDVRCYGDAECSYASSVRQFDMPKSLLVIFGNVFEVGINLRFRLDMIIQLGRQDVQISYCLLLGVVDLTDRRPLELDAGFGFCLDIDQRAPRQIDRSRACRSDQRDKNSEYPSSCPLLGFDELL
jgi:hypothetical protein